MDKHPQHPDKWEDLFRQLPEKELPPAFRFRVMQQVMQEAVRRQKRNERIGILLVSLASALMAGLAIAALFYIDLPRLSIPFIRWGELHFYLYIGVLSLVLLWVDHKLRRAFHKDE